MDLSRHLEGLRGSLAAYVDHAHHAGLDTRTPTAPDWTVRELLAHTGMVHRWAHALIRGERVEAEPFEQEGLAVADPVRWLHDGGLALADALEQAPEDLDAPVFLKDAPAPREFWARRQCHETTIHAVDALAARLGRVPRAADVDWISRELAVDGIDELVTGFAPRGRFGLRTDPPTSFGVLPTDVTDTWLLEASDRPVVATRGQGAGADVVVEGTAVELYLALWNRTDTVEVEGFEHWRRTARITWA